MAPSTNSLSTPSDVIAAETPLPPVSLSAARTDRHRRVQNLLEELTACTDERRRKELVGHVVLEHRAVARSVALRYRNRGVEQADLEQIASLGLLKAAQRWRPDRCADFLQFAVPTMTGEIKRYFRDHTSLVRPIRRIQELRAAMAKVIELHPETTDAEIGAQLNVSVDEVREARRAGDLARPRSLDAPGPDGSDWSETIGEQETGFNLVEDRIVLAKVMAVMTEREKRVLSLRYYDELSQAAIGKIIGVSQMQVSRILRTITEKARRFQPESRMGLAG